MNLAFRKGTLAGDPDLDLQHETESKPREGNEQGTKRTRAESGD